MITKICKQCGKEFTSDQNAQIYCSAACREEHREAIKQMVAENHTTRHFVCRWCGKEFEATTYRKFCCEACKKEFHSKRKPNNKKNMKNIVKINELARKEGLSYGQYVAKYGYEILEKGR